MKLLATILTCLYLGSVPSFGSSIIIPIGPHSLKQSDFNFEYYVTPTSKGAKVHFQATLLRETLSKFKASLAIVETIRTPGQIDERIEDQRPIPVKVKNKIYSADFDLNSQELNTKNLCFVFREQVYVMMSGKVTFEPSATYYTFLLKDN